MLRNDSELDNCNESRPIEPHTSMFSNIEIRETPLGYGVFANTDFDLDEIVGEITGTVHVDANYESDYCIDLGENANLEPAAPFRFVNHRCEPNCELVLWQTQYIDGLPYSRLWLQTIRPVRAGEELTIDYAWPAEAAIPCRCQSQRCRGWIVDVDAADRMTVPV